MGTLRKFEDCTTCYLCIHEYTKQNIQIFPITGLYKKFAPVKLSHYTVSLQQIIAIKCIVSCFCSYIITHSVCIILVSTASSADFSFYMTVTIPVDQSQACSSVSLIDDDIAEGTQTFSMSIDSASPTGNFDSSEVVVIEIMDDDGEGACEPYTI